MRTRKIKPPTIEESLGEYIANYLIARHIPSLSCNACTVNTIPVSLEESAEYKRLDDAWFYKSIRKLESSTEWNDLTAYRYRLKKKYLPHELLNCRIPLIDLSNPKTKARIKKALIAALWDWDFCEWSLESKDVELYSDEYSSYVKLKLCLDAPFSYTGADWEKSIES